ncbi:MAG TPA: NUDIX hydrolase [Thermoleophilaceae bacterium]|nr:NUDIX hydrolase [Thermoleophilaceae bacterium]
MGFERIASEAIWQGHIGGVRVDTFRYDDGSEATREIVSHPGAVTVLPFDGEHIWLVRQPREPVGEQALLELPAGKIERPSKGGTAPLCNPPSGEDLEATARRELAEEIGKGANDWRHLVSFYNSPGLLAEENHLFLAQDLYEETRESEEEEERIEIVPLKLDRLDETIGRLRDAKTLIGLLWFRSYLRDGA